VPIYFLKKTPLDFSRTAAALFVPNFLKKKTYPDLCQLKTTGNTNITGKYNWKTDKIAGKIQR